MRIPRCKSVQGHWYGKDNICTRCGFDYNQFLRQQEEAKKKMDEFMTNPEKLLSAEEEELPF